MLGVEATHPLPPVLMLTGLMLTGLVLAVLVLVFLLLLLMVFLLLLLLMGPQRQQEAKSVR
jgi:hypothetical protein